MEVVSLFGVDSDVVGDLEAVGRFVVEDPGNNGVEVADVLEKSLVDVVDL